MGFGGSIRRTTPAGRLPEAVATAHPRHEATAVRGSQTGQPAGAFKVGDREEGAPPAEEQLGSREQLEEFQLSKIVKRGQETRSRFDSHTNKHLPSKVHPILNLCPNQHAAEIRSDWFSIFLARTGFEFISFSVISPNRRFH